MRADASSPCCWRCNAAAPARRRPSWPPSSRCRYAPSTAMWPRSRPPACRCGPRRARPGRAPARRLAHHARWALRRRGGLVVPCRGGRRRRRTRPRQHPGRRAVEADVDIASRTARPGPADSRPVPARCPTLVPLTASRSTICRPSPTPCGPTVTFASGIAAPSASWRAGWLRSVSYSRPVRGTSSPPSGASRARIASDGSPSAVVGDEHFDRPAGFDLSEWWAKSEAVFNREILARSRSAEVVARRPAPASARHGPRRGRRRRWPAPTRRRRFGRRRHRGGVPRRGGPPVHGAGRRRRGSGAGEPAGGARRHRPGHGGRQRVIT